MYFPINYMNSRQIHNQLIKRTQIKQQTGNGGENTQQFSIYHTIKNRPPVLRRKSGFWYS